MGSRTCYGACTQMNGDDEQLHLSSRYALGSTAAMPSRRYALRRRAALSGSTCH